MNFHSAGYFLGYLIWGYALIAAFIFVLYLSTGSFVTSANVQPFEFEAVHRNPILLAVSGYLYGRMKAKQQVDVDSPTEKMEGKNYSSRAIRKWHLAVFIARNPSFRLLRKNALAEMRKTETKILGKQMNGMSSPTIPSHRASIISVIDSQNLLKTQF